MICKALSFQFDTVSAAARNSGNWFKLFIKKFSKFFCVCIHAHASNEKPLNILLGFIVLESDLSAALSAFRASLKNRWKHKCYTSSFHEYNRSIIIQKYKQLSLLILTFMKQEWVFYILNPYYLLCDKKKNLFITGVTLWDRIQAHRFLLMCVTLLNT